MEHNDVDINNKITRDPDFELKSKSSVLNRFFDFSPNLLCIMNREGILLHVNKSWERIFGLSLGEFYGKDIRDYFVSDDVPDTFAKTFKLLGNNTVESFINRLKDSDGRPRFYEWTFQQFDNLIYAAGHDITERLELEQIAQNKKEQFELVIRGSNDGMWDWDIVTNDVFLSPKWKEQLGYSVNELENKYSTFYLLIHPDDENAFKSKLGSYLNSTADIFSAEYRMKHKDGGYRWIWSRGAAMRDETGKAYRMAGSHTDITESKELIKRSQEHEIFLKTILDTVQDAFVVVCNSKITDANETFFKMSGYTREDLESLQFSDLIAEECISEYWGIRERLYNEGHSFVEITSKRKDGSKLDVEVAATVLNSDQSISALFIRDITERKSSEKKLLHFHELLTYIIEHSRIAIAIHDKNSNYMYVSQPYIEMFKLPGKEIIGKNLYDVQTGMPQAYKGIHQRVLSGEIISNYDSNSVFYSGRYVRWECRPWYEQDATVGGFILYIENISEQKRMEQLLINEKEHFKTTLLSVGDGVISTDSLGKITVMNPVSEKLTGWTFEEASGSPLKDVLRIINEQTRIYDRNSLNRVLKAGNVIELSNRIIVSKIGIEIPVDINMAPIKHSDGNITGAVIIIRDVTEKRAEQRQIEFLSYNDVLTGLYNRRYIEDALKRLDTPNNLPLALFSIDVNGLKLTNDAFGHEMGDQLLKTVADILKIACGADYVIGRMGGDEFCILMTNTNDEQASELKEKILKEVSNLKLYPVVASLAIGYAVKYTPLEDIKLIMTISDNRMYQDKIKFGKIMRNQTIQIALQNINSNNEQEQIHTEKVSFYCEAIAKAMKFNEQEVKNAKMAGALHDIGKIMVPSQVLKKAGKLTDDEYNLVKRHPEIGYQMLKTVEEYAHLSECVLYHHERWDGSGYPVGLKGERIPLFARIIAVADAFEAMTAKRPYQKTRTKEQSIEELKANAGKQFDPEIVRIFVENVL